MSDRTQAERLVSTYETVLKDIDKRQQETSNEQTVSSSFLEKLHAVLSVCMGVPVNEVGQHVQALKSIVDQNVNEWKFPIIKQLMTLIALRVTAIERSRVSDFLL